ncbi:MAG: hypothetical protein PHG05_02805 [Candidatus Nanoarchaeia archaeon]|nr:hypothetical protein [Candidatus Nanoarchaeia archaeon]
MINRRKLVIFERILLVILAVLLVVSIVTDGFGKPALSQEKAVDKAVTYINDNVLKGQGTATVEDSSSEGCLYKFKLNVGGSSFDSYVTKDGTILFPQGIALDEQVTDTTTEEPVTEVTKTDKPVVELFVMSHCPYGTQMEKGLIPVIETLKDKADIKIKFVDYAMHGEKEVYEELTQYCIETEMNDKYIDYLSCFLKEGKSEDCIKEVKIDEAKLKTCTDKVDKEYKITDLVKDEANWISGRYIPFNIFKTENDKYGVQGSPTLVINGAQVSSARDSASLLKTICSAFNEKPAECDTELSSESPSAGFGFNTTTGNAAADAGCAS